MFRVRLTLLAVFLVCSLLPSSSVGQHDDPLADANKLFSNREYQQAVEAYKKLLGTTSDTATRAKLRYNLGLAFQKLGRHDNAIDNFREILKMEVNDREPGGSIMETYRNYRPNAHWQIGNSLFAKGDFEGALAAYRVVRHKYPFQSWCGTCKAGFEHKYDLYEAITLEHLGKYDEAVSLYLKIDDIRLVEIYDKAGRLDVLREIVNQRNESYIAEQMRKYSWTRQKASEYVPLGSLQIALESYDLEKAKDWAILLKRAIRLRPQSRYGGKNIALTILARNPDEVIPWLKNEMAKPTDRPLGKVAYEILGLSGTDESVAILKELAEKQQNWWVVADLVGSLNLAGEKGAKALEELELNAKDNLKLAIERNKVGELRPDGNDEIKFPILGEIRSLPGSAEVKWPER